MSHAVAYLPTEGALTWIVDDAVDVVGARIVVDDRNLVRRLVSTTGLAEALPGKLVVSVMLILFADDIEADDVSLEVHVLRDAILVACVLHRVDHLLADGVEVDSGARARAVERLGEDVALLRRPQASRAVAPVAAPAVLVPIPDVKRAEVSLDLGVFRCGVHPGQATTRGHAVKENKVLIVVNHVLHRRLHAVETGSNDARHMWPWVPRVLEVRQARDDHALLNVFVVLQHSFLTVEDRDLCGVFPVSKDARERLLQDLHFHAPLDWERDILIAVLDLQARQLV
mmetsp:Transcript_120740/g.352616  ORF Transcript_120740/g.352616 Transcript_120740/m.352616 type:complete len:285 (+) Transcript_120740:613-1467(+)